MVSFMLLIFVIIAYNVFNMLIMSTQTRPQLINDINMTEAAHTSYEGFLGSTPNGVCGNIC